MFNHQRRKLRRQRRLSDATGQQRRRQGLEVGLAEVRLSGGGRPGLNVIKLFTAVSYELS